MSTAGGEGRGPRRRRRYRGKGEARTRSVRFTLSEEEYEALAAAAEALGLAVGAYAAEAVVAAARREEPPQWAPWRDLLVALMRASAQVCKVGVNLNQAVAALHATGEPTAALERHAAVAAGAIQRLDEVAEEAGRRLS